MAKNAITTHELAGMRVVGGKNGTKRIGKVRSFVFHPKGKRVIGFIVKRPDFLWMFKRKDLFVSIDGYDLIDGRVVVKPVPEATDKAACKSLGVDWDDCVLWVGMPLLSEDEESLGVVGNVTFNQLTGSIYSVEANTGATANALLGRREIPAELIRGFKRGIGVALTQTGEPEEGLAVADSHLGAILVSNEAKDIAVEGGLAEKAGQATAVVSDKAGKAVKKTGETVNKGAYKLGEQIGKTKDAFGDMQKEYKKESDADEAATKKLSVRTPAEEGSASKEAKSKKTAKKPESGNAARAVGEHLKKSKGMFSAFKDEYSKARHDDD